MNQREYVREFLINIGMDLNNLQKFLVEIDMLLDKYGKEIENICTLYRQTCEMADGIEMCEELSVKSGVHIYTIRALIVIISSEWLLKKYNEKGYSEDIFWDTMSDLKCKLVECYQKNKIWGTSTKDWYDLIFKMKVFKLGRLEFGRMTYKGTESQKIGDFVLNPGDIVFGVHIPSCGPMPRELRMDSYKKAYNFFEKERGNKPIIFYCHSWLLYEKNREIFPPHLNMVDFLNDWKIIESTPRDNYISCARLFGCDYSGNPEDLPADNTARRAMVEWLKKGNKTGAGVGIMAFDGEKIIVS